MPMETCCLDPSTSINTAYKMDKYISRKNILYTGFLKKEVDNRIFFDIGNLFHVHTFHTLGRVGERHT